MHGNVSEQKPLELSDVIELKQLTNIEKYLSDIEESCKSDPKESINIEELLSKDFSDIEAI